MDTRKARKWKDLTHDTSAIARRKRDFQNENRSQARDGRLSSDDISFIPRDVAKRAKFKSKA
jgi:hypothetical protein